MKYIVAVLFIAGLCNAQAYYFQNEAIADTFYYSGETDIYGNALPSFTYPPEVIMPPYGTGHYIKRMETDYFVVSLAGSYSFMISPEPSSKVYPQGEVFIANTTANIRIFWQDAEPQYMLKDDTLITLMYLNTANGYCVANVNDINYFDNLTQDTLGTSRGNDTHYQPAGVIVGDTAYTVWGFHQYQGRNNKFYFGHPQDTVGMDSINGYNYMSLPWLTTFGDSIGMVIRSNNNSEGGGQYGTSILKFHKNDFPSVSKSWLVTNNTTRYMAYYHIFTHFSGTSAYTFGKVRDLNAIEAAKGVGGVLETNLYFTEWRNNLNKMYNLTGTDISSYTPFNYASADSFKVLDTDTLCIYPMDVQRQGNKVFLDYYYENIAKPDSYDVYIGWVDLDSRTWTSVKTNLGNVTIATAVFKIYVDENYIYLNGYYAANSAVDYGANKIYRASRSNPSVFTEYKDNKCITWGHQMYNIGGSAIFCFMHQYSPLPRLCLLRMYRDL